MSDAKEIAEDIIGKHSRDLDAKYDEVAILAQAYLNLLAQQEGKVLVPKKVADKWCRRFESITNKRWPLSSLKAEINAAISAYIDYPQDRKPSTKQ